MTQNDAKYRWYILFLLSLTGCFVIAMPQMCMPVLFKEISVDLDLSLVQLGVVWGMIPLAGLLLMLVGGMLSDKFGTKKMLFIGSILTGVAGMARALSTDFTTITVTMFIFGILQVITAPSMIRACGIWFSGNRLGLATGIYSMSMGFGFLMSSMISASVLSPLFGGWKGVLIAYGIVSMLVGILWFFTRSKPSDAGIPEEKEAPLSAKESLLKVIRMRNLWVLSIIIMLQMACVMGMLGYLPTYLKDIGWNPATADSTVALFHGISTVFTVPVVLLSDKLKSRKIILFAAGVLTSVGVGILGFNSGAGVWAAMIIAGIIRDGFMATQMAMLIEMKGLDVRYLGAAIGFVNTVSRIGEIVSPPIGGRLAEINPQYPFLMWSGLAAVALLGFLFFKKESAVKISQD
jgi:cyanate permease